MTVAEGLDFASSLSCLVNPALAGLRTRLALVPGLASAERTVIADACAAALGEAAHRKVSRVLILELNAARVTGRLRAADSAGRWDEFLSLSAGPQFWDSLGTRYPTMLGRLRTVLAGRCAAACQMAARLAADRDAIAGLPGTDPGELTGVRFGAGDSHRGGQTVAVLEFAAGRVMYKPRSVRVDAVLGELLAEVLGSTAAGTGIRVPDVLSREGYGWVEFVTHRYCADDAELACFYRGIGHWLAVLRLIGGTDLHVENMIACGPVPVVVDCEVLFTPMPPASASGLGQAVDRAFELANETVLRTGMLPTRGVGLGWRGVDISAAGSLPGQQPASDIPVIVDAGLDTARIGFASDPVTVYANHPSPEPALARYWNQVIAGFAELTATLRTMDRQGRLEPLLRRFADCPVRMVLRATEVYAEVGRMLWHPVSLHDPGPAEERARGLLTRMAESVPGAPDDPQVIAAEVVELLNGDVPFFTTTPARGQLTGPAGTTWLPERDLITDALTRWRGADLDLDRGIIQATLVSAYLNDGWMPTDGPMPGGESRLAGLDRRRRALAAMVLGQIRDAAISAADGTVTWIAPVLNATGWAVQPLSPDLYSGLPGVAVLLAAYERESARGRATRVDGLDELLAAALRTMRAAEDLRERVGRSSDVRPRPPGGFVGLGSQIWAWLTLDRWGAAGTDGISRARKLASQIPAATAVASCELLAGMAGAIVPLLQLAAVTGEDRWIAEATVIGNRLTAAGQSDRDALYWPSPRWPAGLGGCAHGATGIGWALARLALATGDTRSAAAAQAAFRFEERLYDAAQGSWLDLRQPGQTAVAWCHGAVGIGLLTADLAARGSPVRPDVVSRAAQAAERLGFGWNHTLCHGDLGCWELLSTAVTNEPGQDDRQQRLELDARVIGSLEHNGPVTGLARDAFAPGLLPGLGGIGYQLLRMHPQSDLPSILTLSDPVRSAP